jgi:hypothetical protein
MTIVKFLSGDIKEYKSDCISDLILSIGIDIGIDKRFIQLIKNEEDSEIEYFVFIQESKDYPFNCWENYFRVFTHFLKCDSYEDSYKELI